MNWAYAPRVHQFTPARLAQLASSAGYGPIAIEWDAVDEDGVLYNQDRWEEHRAACRALNLQPGVWVTQGKHIADLPSNAEFAIAEIETPDDYDGILYAIKHSMLPPYSKAIVTTFGGRLVVKETDGKTTDIEASAARAKPLIDAGFDCLTEAYIGSNPQATPDNLNQIAVEQLGFRRSYPVFGLFDGATLADYASWFRWPGRYWVWSAETALS